MVKIRRMANKELSELINTHAKSKGFTGKEAAKALRKLEDGGMMAQIAPQLQQQFMSMNPNATPREKLRQKLSAMSASRQSKQVKAIKYEEQRTQVLKEKEEEERKKAEAAADVLKKERNHRKRLRELEKRMGTISDDIYFQSMELLQSGKLKDESEIKRHNNIIELYGRQQAFKEKIDLDKDLEDLA